VIDDQRVPPVGVGDRAPGFSLPSSDGGRVSLDETLARGPAVLLWYVFDFGRI